MQKTFISILADFFANLKIEDLKEDVIERAKVCILDTIAVAYAGHETEPAAIISDVVKRFETPNDQATVWVRGVKTNYIFAAVNNCMFAHSMIHDDQNLSTKGHAGNLIVPTALAVAEARQRPCSEILPAIAIGYEAMGRIGAPAIDYSIERGFRSTSNYGPFGVAAAAGKIMDLDAEKMSNALLCAASYCMGLLEPFNVGSMEWRFQNSLVIMGGCMAALTAEKGLRAAKTALEGDAGFISAFCGRDVRDKIIEAWMQQSESLGKEYDITKTLFKPYATCGYNQMGCSIALNVIENNSITPEMVKEIIIRVSPDNKAYPGVDYHGPFDTTDAALMSKQFMVGAAVITRDLQVDTYLDRLHDPEIQRIAKLVRIEADEKMSSMDTEITFITKDNQAFKGDLGSANFASFMLNRDTVIQKFRSLARRYISSAKMDQISDAVFHLEKLKSVSELTTLLTKG